MSHQLHQRMSLWQNFIQSFGLLPMNKKNMSLELGSLLKFPTTLITRERSCISVHLFLVTWQITDHFDPEITSFKVACEWSSIAVFPADVMC